MTSLQDRIENGSMPEPNSGCWIWQGKIRGIRSPLVRESMMLTENGVADGVPQRALRALNETDAMPPALRQCVHEFGYAIVHACIDAGVKDPARIRNLVREIWAGARQPAQQHKKGHATTAKISDLLDWVLIQAGAEISALTLVRILKNADLVIVPRSPSSVMVEASIATVRATDERFTKTEKHRRRLEAAIDAVSRRMWPHLYDPHL